MDERERRDEINQLPVTQTIDADALVPQALALVTAEGELRLRDDIPTHKLLFGLPLLDIVREQMEAQQAGDLERFEVASDRREALTLQIVALIVRHSHPTLRIEDVKRLTTSEQREEVVAHFFSTRLTPYFARRAALATRSTSTPGDSETPAPGAAVVEVGAASKRRARKR